jgi:hypothetical protein
MTRLQAVSISVSQVINAIVSADPSRPFCAACYVNHWVALEKIMDTIYFLDAQEINGQIRRHCYLSFINYVERCQHGANRGRVSRA